MNNRGQTGVVTWYLSVFVFVIIWAFALGNIISLFGQNMIVVNSLTGIEAFLMANLNLVILIALIVSSSVITAIGMRGGGA